MPELSLKEFKNKIKKNGLYNFYFIYGNEKYLIKKCTKFIINNLLAKNISDFNFEKFDGLELNLTNLQDFITSVNFTSDTKCSLINNLDIEKLHKQDELTLYNIVKNMDNNTILIISQTTLDINKKKSAPFKRFLKTFSNYGYFLEINHLNNFDLKNYIINYTKAKNCVLSDKNAFALIDKCGTDLYTLTNELDKICSLSLEGHISYDVIQNFCTTTFETNVFFMIDCIIQEKYENTYNQLQLLLQQGQSPIAIVTLLAMSYIDMFRVKVNPQSDSLIKHFNYKGKAFRLNKAKDQAGKFSLDQLTLSLNQIINTDIKLKSTSLNSAILLEELITKLFMICNSTLSNK